MKSASDSTPRVVKVAYVGAAVPAVALCRSSDDGERSRWWRGSSSTLGKGRCRLLNSKLVGISMHNGCSVRRRAVMLLGAHAVWSSLTNTKLSCACRSQPIETDRKDRSPSHSIGKATRILRLLLANCR